MMVTGALEKARLYIESHSDLSEKFPTRFKTEAGPCITFSRETGAGADCISSHLLKHLSEYNKEYIPHWIVFDKNLIEKVLEDHHLPNALAKFMVEDKYSNINSIINEIFGVKPPQHVLVKKVSETILQLAHLGNVIIIGRGATIIASQLKNAFNVRVVAPFENRVSHIQHLLNLKRQHAIEYVIKEDIARKNYMLVNFNKDIEDPLLYHLIINSGKIGYDEAAGIISEAVIKKFPKYFERESHFFEMYY